MAYPLPVSPAPIQSTDQRSVSAHVLMRYPGAEGEDVNDDRYISGGVMGVEVFDSGIPADVLCTTIVPGAQDPYCGLPTASTSTPGFTTPTPDPAFSVVTFEWVDLQSYFWFSPLGETIETFDPIAPGPVVTPPSAAWCPPTLSFPGAFACPPGESPITQPLVCPIGSVAWDTNPDLWEGAATCWAS